MRQGRSGLGYLPLQAPPRAPPAGQRVSEAGTPRPHPTQGGHRPRRAWEQGRAGRDLDGASWSATFLPSLAPSPAPQLPSSGTDPSAPSAGACKHGQVPSPAPIAPEPGAPGGQNAGGEDAGRGVEDATTLMPRAFPHLRAFSAGLPAAKRPRVPTASRVAATAGPCPLPARPAPPYSSRQAPPCSSPSTPSFRPASWHPLAPRPVCQTRSSGALGCWGLHSVLPIKATPLGEATPGILKDGPRPGSVGQGDGGGAST